MAVILEIIDAAGGRARVRLDGLAMTIGRSVANDIVLDDPYVDATHAEIRLEGDALIVEDRGSVNRLVRPGERERHERLTVSPGEQIRIGRTMLRVRETSEVLPPALPDPELAIQTVAASPDDAQASGRFGRWARATPVRLLVVAAALGAVSLSTWLGSYDRAVGSEVFGITLGVGLLMMVWAGMWSVAGRVVVHRFDFPGHLAVIATAGVVAMTFIAVEGWLNFLAPDHSLITVLSWGYFLAVIAGVLAGHLALASRMRALHRWRAGVLIAAAIAVIAGLSELVEEEHFTDIPTFSGVLKPLSPNWVPTRTIDEFGTVMVQLREEADQLADRAEWLTERP